MPVRAEVNSLPVETRTRERRVTLNAEFRREIGGEKRFINIYPIGFHEGTTASGTGSIAGTIVQELAARRHRSQ